MSRFSRAPLMATILGLVVASGCNVSHSNQPLTPGVLTRGGAGLVGNNAGSLIGNNAGSIIQLDAPAAFRGSGALAMNLALPVAQGYRVTAQISDIASLKVTLLHGTETVASANLTKANIANGKAAVRFTNLAPGSYAIELVAFDANNQNIGQSVTPAAVQPNQMTNLNADLQLAPAQAASGTADGGLQANITVHEGGTTATPTPGPSPTTGATASPPEASTAPSGTPGPTTAPTDGGTTPPTPGATPSPGDSPAPSTAPHGDNPSPTPAPTPTPPLTLSFSSVTTVAGTSNGFADGTGTNAQFNQPFSVVVGRNGNVYIADTDNNRIRMMTPAGVVTTLAGNGTAGHVDGTGVGAEFNSPQAIAVNGEGTVFVADANNNCIRRVSPTGVVTTIAGSTSAGFADGAGTAARFNNPTGLVLDGHSNLYVADAGNNCIRKIPIPADTVTTFAGSTTGGYADGQGSAAKFRGPHELALDPSGNLVVTDLNNHLVRVVDPSGNVITLAGKYVFNASTNTATGGFADGPAANAQFAGPIGVAVDSAGNVVVTDPDNQRLRLITTDGNVTTLSGNGTPGYTDGALTSGLWRWPRGVAFDAAGHLYVADTGNHRIRLIQ